MLRERTLAHSPPTTAGFPGMPWLAVIGLTHASSVTAPASIASRLRCGLAPDAITAELDTVIMPDENVTMPPLTVSGTVGVTSLVSATLAPGASSSSQIPMSPTRVRPGGAMSGGIMSGGIVSGGASGTGESAASLGCALE